MQFFFSLATRRLLLPLFFLVFPHTTVTHTHAVMQFCYLQHCHIQFCHTHTHDVTYNFGTYKAEGRMSKSVTKNGVHLGHSQVETQINTYVQDNMIHRCHSRLQQTKRHYIVRFFPKRVVTNGLNLFQRRRTDSSGGALAISKISAAKNKCLNEHLQNVRDTNAKS